MSSRVILQRDDIIKNTYYNFVAASTAMLKRVCVSWMGNHSLIKHLLVHGHIRPFFMIEVHTISVLIVNTQRIIMYSNQLLDDVSNISHSRSIPSICAIPTTATILPFPQCLQSIIAMCTSLFVIMTLYTGGKLRWR